MVWKRVADGSRPPFLQPSPRGSRDKAGFDQFCEEACAGFYHATLGLARRWRPWQMYFRIMTVGFLRRPRQPARDRLASGRFLLTLRQFLSIGLDESTPDHVTISRTRRLIDGEDPHQRIFTLGVGTNWRKKDSSKARPSEWIRPRWRPMRR